MKTTPSSSMVYTFTDLKDLNAHLADKPYVDGFKLTGNDGFIMIQVASMQIPDSLVHVKRWFKNVSSYSISELKALGGCSCCGKTCAAKKQDDEIIEEDLFADSDSESEDTKKAKEETRRKIAEAKAAGTKLKKVDRSMIIMEIKPHDNETDMQPILDTITEKVQMEGLQWGKGEIKEGNFGIKIVVMPAVIIDDLCSTEELCDKIIETYTDDVIQNCDIVSFNKME